MSTLLFDYFQFLFISLTFYLERLSSQFLVYKKNDHSKESILQQNSRLFDDPTIE